MKFISSKSKNFNENIYVRKIGFVTKEDLNISVGDKKLCNLRVDDLTKKFNNSILVALNNEKI